MTKRSTKIKAHSRKGTKGVKAHQREITKKEVPHSYNRKNITIADINRINFMYHLKYRDTNDSKYLDKQREEIDKIQKEFFAQEIMKSRKGKGKIISIAKPKYDYFRAVVESGSGTATYYMPVNESVVKTILKQKRKWTNPAWTLKGYPSVNTELVKSYKKDHDALIYGDKALQYRLGLKKEYKEEWSKYN